VVNTRRGGLVRQISNRSTCWKSTYARPSTPVVESTCASLSVTSPRMYSHGPARLSGWSGRAAQKNCGHDARTQRKMRSCAPAPIPHGIATDRYI